MPARAATSSNVRRGRTAERRPAAPGPRGATLLARCRISSRAAPTSIASSSSSRRTSASGASGSIQPRCDERRVGEISSASRRRAGQSSPRMRAAPRPCGSVVDHSGSSPGTRRSRRPPVVSHSNAARAVPTHRVRHRPAGVGASRTSSGWPRHSVGPRRCRSSTGRPSPPPRAAGGPREEAGVATAASARRPTSAGRRVRTVCRSRSRSRRHAATPRRRIPSPRARRPPRRRAPGLAREQHLGPAASDRA